MTRIQHRQLSGDARRIAGGRVPVMVTTLLAMGGIAHATPPVEEPATEESEVAVVELQSGNGQVETTIMIEALGSDGARTFESIQQILADRVQVQGLTVRRSDGEAHEIAIGSPMFGFDRPAAVSFPTPTVMIGVRMETPNEALAGHLGINPADATMLSVVYDGLAASKAGLSAYDVIVDINGAGSAGVETIREQLRLKEAGETVDLLVLQQGEERTMRVTLEAYDAERLPTRQLLTAVAGDPRSQGGFLIGNGGEASGTVQFWAPGVANAPGSMQTQRQLDQLDARLERLERMLLRYMRVADPRQAIEPTEAIDAPGVNVPGERPNLP